MSEKILIEMTITAKIPSGCEWNEETKSPLNKYEIEFPKPQPGQNSKPRFAIGQIVKCECSGELIKIR